MRRIVVAGVSSGVGKTTISCALLAAFRRRGLRVQPFKIGPDYLDPSQLTAAAGQTARNLDSVLLPAAMLRALFARAAASADLSIVEGVMGLFDGRNDRGAEGSTAHVARLLDAPVVVVLDVARQARTAGAVALGCARFDPALTIVGFILNRVASPAHERAAREAIEAITGLPVLGAIPRDAAPPLPARHLGLVPAIEGTMDAAQVDRLAHVAERHVALDRLWSLADVGGRHETADHQDAEPSAPAGRARIALARDRAFNFYYEDSLELLEEAGAQLIPFSPLADRRLPSGTQGVYLGGGFPELCAGELAGNTTMRASIQRAARAGVPIYGECGGLMYLGQALTDFEGRRHAMVGLLPMESAMQRDRVTLGYRTATSLRPTPLLAAGARIVGHEFHYSRLAAPAVPETAAYRIAGRDPELEGYAQGNVLASYVHLHFGTDPSMARRFVSACAHVEGI